MKKYISPKVEISMFEAEDFIQTSGVTIDSLAKGTTANTVQWSDVTDGTDTIDVTAQ